MSKLAKRYSIYDRKTDMPVVIYRSSKECAKALGIEVRTFYQYIARQRVGKPCVRYDIYEDELEEEDKPKKLRKKRECYG